MTSATTPEARVRRIGTAGTIARILVGILMLGSAIVSQLPGPQLLTWLTALIALPGVVLGWQLARARLRPAPLDATGPIGHLLNIAVFFALYLTPLYAPALSFTSDAALLFYGASMLLAAARGYAGCEVLAISNWLLRRNDQIGCPLFLPVDMIEKRRR